MNPMTATGRLAARTANSAASRRCEIASSAKQAEVVATIATPPPRGVGRVCELRSLGTSSKPRERATLCMPRVSSADAARHAPASTISSTGMRSTFREIPSHGLLHTLLLGDRWCPIELRTRYGGIDDKRAAQPLDFRAPCAHGPREATH